ncbi:MAG: hypothetical protein AAGM67_07060, partial [Bacteroidota bacterium]
IPNLMWINCTYITSQDSYVRDYIESHITVEILQAPWKKILAVNDQKVCDVVEAYMDRRPVDFYVHSALIKGPKRGWLSNASAEKMGYGATWYLIVCMTHYTEDERLSTQNFNRVVPPKYREECKEFLDRNFGKPVEGIFSTWNIGKRIDLHSS